MSQHCCRPLTILGLAMLLQVGGVAKPAAQAAATFERLTFVVSVPDRQFLVFEPIPLILRLENHSGEPITGHTLLEFAAGLTTMLVQPDGAGAYEVAPLSLGAGILEPGSTIVPAGKRHQVEELLTLGLDRAFPQPGRYVVQFILHSRDWKEEVRSNVVPIVVRVPDALEQTAQDYMQSTGAAGRFFTGLLDDDFDQRQTEVALNFANTAYADYANFFLGGRSLGLRDYERARAHLSRVAIKGDFPLRERAAKLLLELAELQGK